VPSQIWGTILEFTYPSKLKSPNGCISNFW
jgi:hypothetical protein